MSKPSALKGVVTESGPGPGAPNFGAEISFWEYFSGGSLTPYNLLPLQFKHPTIETELTACFERNRINGGTSKQMSTPAENWSVSLGEFYAFCEHCFADPMWTVIKNASDKLDDGYSEMKMKLNRNKDGTQYHEDETQYHTAAPGERYELPTLSPGRKVHAYDMAQFFVKPWTAGCGHGVALMMNALPIQCQVMISHAWGEDMDSLYTTLKLHEQNTSEFSTDTRIWFCLFGLYQGAGAAPFLAEIIYALTPSSCRACRQRFVQNGTKRNICG